MLYSSMGYYHLFRDVIPLPKVGYARVTHPSATLLGALRPHSRRLASFRHAASVRSEPVSYSPKNILYTLASSANFRKQVYLIDRTLKYIHFLDLNQDIAHTRNTIRIARQRIIQFSKNKTGT